MYRKASTHPGTRWWIVPAMFLPLFVLACGGTPSKGETAIVPPTRPATALPTAVPTAVPTATATATPEPTEDLTSFLQRTRANELGMIMVLEYHLIEEPEDRWSRTPSNFRADLEYLIAEGYYPINMIDLALGQIDVPAGKTPVVLTFDDSPSGQFRMLPDGTVDPNCAVGIILDVARERPDDWRPRATFYPLLDVDVPDRVLFGQPEWAEQKLRDLVEWGMEVGSHTISHLDMGASSAELVQWQLAVSENTIESMIPGYEVRSLSVPFGSYPEDWNLLHGGEWEGQSYDFETACWMAGGASVSPFADTFDVYYIQRIQAVQEELSYWFRYFEEHPEMRYISDGDLTSVSIPDNLDPQVYGNLRGDLPADLIVRRYTPSP